MTWQEKFKRDFFTGLPSSLSFLRVIFGALFPFLILSSKDSLHFLAFALFLFGVVTDYLDGWLARKFNLVSDFGKILDPTADKILILTPLVTFSFLGYYSIWWAVPIVIREILITFFRLAWLREGKAAAAEKLGKLKLGFQVITIFIVFLHFILRDRIIGWGLEGMFAALINLSLLISLALTLVSGFSFLYSHRQDLQTRDFAQYAGACGVGLIGTVPGTWGSVLGVIIFLLIQWNFWLYAGTVAFLFFAAHWSISRLDLTQTKDPQFVVIDEVLGMLVTLFAVPLRPEWIAAGFVLFRAFDILKPFPLRRLEKLPGAWGIVGDDLGAGLYSRLILQLFIK